MGLKGKIISVHNGIFVLPDNDDFRDVPLGEHVDDNAFVFLEKFSRHSILPDKITMKIELEADQFLQRNWQIILNETMRGEDVKVTVSLR